MPVKVMWGITGSGDLISEVVAVMAEISRHEQVEVTAVLSKAAVTVLHWYKLRNRVDEIAKKVFVEEDANTPFVVGPLQIGRFDCLLVAPATANTVAKVAHGIADSIITNAIAQTNKTNVDIHILPVDQKKGTTVTILPGGEKLELKMRDVDVENADKLRNMEGINLLEEPREIKAILDKYLA